MPNNGTDQQRASDVATRIARGIVAELDALVADRDLDGAPEPRVRAIVLAELLADLHPQPETQT